MVTTEIVVIDGDDVDENRWRWWGDDGNRGGDNDDDDDCYEALLGSKLVFELCFYNSHSILTHHRIILKHFGMMFLFFIEFCLAILNCIRPLKGIMSECFQTCYTIWFGHSDSGSRV